MSGIWGKAFGYVMNEIIAKPLANSKVMQLAALRLHQTVEGVAASAGSVVKEASKHFEKHANEASRILAEQAKQNMKPTKKP